MSRKKSGGKDRFRRTGVVRDSRYLNHIAGKGHPESPERLRVIYDQLDRPEYADNYQFLVPRMAEKDELAWNHAPSYIDRIERTAGVDSYQLDPDTATSAGSWEAARLAVGGVFAGLDAVDAGEVKNGFALVRPPGHHAEADHAMGFCLFNNIALGAHYARRKLGYRKVLIVDWDLHHGNGTQHSFYSDPSVLYFSTHQYPYYPGSGGIHETGEGAGRGYTVNVPLRAGAGDEEFAFIFKTLLVPVCRAFEPDLLLVSAGFDIYRDDPLGGMNVSEEGFARLAAILLDLANECCAGKILFSLEGGYNFDGLRDGVTAVLNKCGQDGKSDQTEVSTSVIQAAVLDAVDRVRQAQGAFWSF